jgi:4-aminobutyrate aminotransferase
MVEDLDGNIYLDAQAGIAVASTGHCHPRVSAAIKEQADILIHICGTDFHYPGYATLCERLDRLARRIGVAPGAEPPAAESPDWFQTFLTNSGTEAIEAAIKLARNHTRRSHLIAFHGAFHGRTLGSLSLTSKAKYRKGFGPLLPDVHHVAYGDAGAIERELFPYSAPPEEVAAIFVEPILGEGGYIVPPAEFLQHLREICDRHGILLVFDEVQSGMGRTGRMFAAEHTGVRPDILVLGKGLASGMPLGAMMARRRIMTWPRGSHGSTFAGNPVCIAAALATLDLLEEGLIENAGQVGARLKQRLQQALAGHKAVEEVRGIGLMIGVDFSRADISAAVANLLFTRGLLVLEAGKKAIRISPPLVITAEQADIVADVFVQACTDVVDASETAAAATGG